MRVNISYPFWTFYFAYPQTLRYCPSSSLSFCEVNCQLIAISIDQGCRCDSMALTICASRLDHLPQHHIRQHKYNVVCIDIQQYPHNDHAFHSHIGTRDRAYLRKTPYPS
ncbi:hypothetical protein AG1IA_09437 [Rhizoctonia solani AG-1 IA]|uniref:Uncharacterized protein n=1 Tax=Thanatephorus cucumeris (strain AG1-IA) TaxID=983506 RepID=L8WI94_THACA|nr:hypothetical protein AG1IA_09437 [Rhizoctonia solani AG-1 IA]